MPPIDETPSALRAVAAHLRDACDGPLDGDAACDRAAAIVEAVGDPWFVEAIRHAAESLRSDADVTVVRDYAEIFRGQAEAIGRVLAAIGTGGGR